VHAVVQIFSLLLMQLCFLVLQVLLHDPDENPLMLERGFKVSPGFLTQVAVTTQYVSITEL